MEFTEHHHYRVLVAGNTLLKQNIFEINPSGDRCEGGLQDKQCRPVLNYHSHNASVRRPQVNARVCLNQSESKQPCALHCVTSDFRGIFVIETAAGGAILKEDNCFIKRSNRRIQRHVVPGGLSRE